jgi:PHP family Zn ribbon phosphoesterase
MNNMNDIHETTHRKQRELQKTIREVIRLKQMELQKLKNELDALEMVNHVLTGSEQGYTQSRPASEPTNGADKEFTQMLP